MNFKVTIKEYDLEVLVTIKSNMKNCYLRVLDKKTIEVRASKYFEIHDIKKIILLREEWILKNILNFEKNSLNEDEFLYFGKKESLLVYKINSQKELDEFYKQKAKEYIPFLVEKFAQKMQLFPTKLKYRKNKRTWGSCNYKDELNFNFLLMKYPIEVIEYVVIHELAHIRHKNHSKSFWSLVELYCPDYKKREKYFKSFL